MWLLFYNLFIIYICIIIVIWPQAKISGGKTDTSMKHVFSLWVYDVSSFSKLYGQCYRFNQRMCLWWWIERNTSINYTLKVGKCYFIYCLQCEQPFWHDVICWTSRLSESKFRVERAYSLVSPSLEAWKVTRVQALVEHGQSSMLGLM